MESLLLFELLDQRCMYPATVTFVTLGAMLRTSRNSTFLACAVRVDDPVAKSTVSWMVL
jgi:hypothetical protein